MSCIQTKLAFALAGMLLACAATAQTVYQDDFTGTAAKQDWVPLGDACLTVGGGGGTIPACSGKTDTNGKALPTDVKDGALLLTPAVNSQTGAILSNFTFPMSQGLSVTFTTYTYGSTVKAGPANLGADGITFFLTDGTYDVPADTGATGGAMGYSCSWTNTAAGNKWNGIAHGYLGLGMDEYGNYLNSGDNGHLGYGDLNTNAAGAPSGHGGNKWENNVTSAPTGGSGKEYQPNRIGMRGAGDVNYAALSKLNPTYYSSDDSTKIANACKSATYQATDGKYYPLEHDYNVIPDAYKALPENEPIADVDATKRTDAWPITYRITISPNGLLNFYYSYDKGNFQTVLANKDISTINGTPPASFRFGFSAGTGGQNNVHEITCFSASPLQSNASASANTVTGRVTSDTQVFLASYSADNWWGALVADPLVTQADGSLAVGTAANWDAKCKLTGANPCATITGNKQYSDNVPVQDPDKRHLYTVDAAGKGVELTWGNLDTDTAAQTALQHDAAGTVDTNGSKRVDWLRGERSVEQLQSPPGDLRARTYVLGDIINSSPTFVGAPTVGVLPDGFLDLLYTSATNPENNTAAAPTTAYSKFVTDNTTRENVVYVGSNDGFLHGFRAGSFSGGVFNDSTNDGQEVLGYMPRDVLLKKAASLTDPLYTHDYLVDATPVVGDVFYDSTWHTWLVGGVGSSGREIYALDVTDPTTFAAGDVIGDWDNASTGLGHLGNTVGTPIIARLHNGDWAFIFGSGLVPKAEAAAQLEGVYIGLIDPSNGSVTFQFLSAGVTPQGVGDAPGGIVDVAQVDLDGDHIADYLYAGDTDGRVWRFDLTSDKAATWAVGPIVFQALDASGNAQPITTAITVLAVQTAMKERVMLYFGTGQMQPVTASQPATYATGTQAFYGIWDWNMDAWNALKSLPYAALTGTQSITLSGLLKQVSSPTAAAATPPAGGGATPPATPVDSDYRYLDATSVVCWQGETAITGCTTYDQYGWYFDLPDKQDNATTGEQIIYNATYIGGAVVVNTAVPPPTSTVQCTVFPQQGWTMTFNPATGGGFTTSYQADANGNYITGDKTVGGSKTNGVGQVTHLQPGDGDYLLTQTVQGVPVLKRVNFPVGSSPARVSWREMVSP